MFTRKLALLLGISTTRHEPKIRKPLVIFHTHKKARFHTETLPPVTKAKKFIGNIWRIECADNCTYFVLVEC